jgi:hypothetical protein
VAVARASSARVERGEGRGLRAAGAEATALVSEDWVARLSPSRTGGVDVAYDSIGTTLPQSFQAVRTGGHVVFFGMAGGDPEPVDPRMLMDTSKSLTGGDLWNVLTSHEERVERAAELFEAVRSGRLDVRIAARFPLAEGGRARVPGRPRRARQGSPDSLSVAVARGGTLASVPTVRGGTSRAFSRCASSGLRAMCPQGNSHRTGRSIASCIGRSDRRTVSPTTP